MGMVETNVCIGTEAMVIPIDAQPGGSYALTCPDQNSYYQWQGKATSGQYYVNPLGVGVADGCIWSNGDKPVGNWAPINLGVGYSNGAAWLSIFQNKPTTLEKLDFNIEIIADNMSGKCKYIVGKGFCSGDGYSSCNDDGCTVRLLIMHKKWSDANFSQVSVSEGKATYKLTMA